MADLSPDVVSLVNALPSAIGAAVGGFVAGLGPFRRRLRREARSVVRDELERHEREHHPAPSAAAVVTPAVPALVAR